MRFLKEFCSYSFLLVSYLIMHVIYSILWGFDGYLVLLCSTQRSFDTDGWLTVSTCIHSVPIRYVCLILKKSSATSGLKVQ